MKKVYNLRIECNAPTFVMTDTEFCQALEEGVSDGFGEDIKYVKLKAEFCDKDQQIAELKEQLHELPKKIVEDFYDEIRHGAILEDDYCPNHNLERKYGVRKCLLEDIRTTILKKYGG